MLINLEAEESVAWLVTVSKLEDPSGSGVKQRRRENLHQDEDARRGLPPPISLVRHLGSHVLHQKHCCLLSLLSFCLFSSTFYQVEDKVNAMLPNNSPLLGSQVCFLLFLSHQNPWQEAPENSPGASEPFTVHCGAEETQTPVALGRQQGH